MTRERFALITIVTHLAVATLHGVAHGALAVPAGGRAGLLVVAAAVYVGPVVALAGLLGGRRAAGALVLLASMATALVYGLAFHYFLRTPDHVAYAPSGPWGEVFRSSAAVIAILEACGLAAGVLLLPSPLGRRALADGGLRGGAQPPGTQAGGCPLQR
jgi:hypothetical protein